MERIRLPIPALEEEAENLGEKAWTEEEKIPVEASAESTGVL